MANRDGAGANVPAEADVLDPTLEEELTLSELVNRVLDRGVFLRGEAVISVAGVDLVYLGLQVLLSSVETMEAQFRPDRPDDGNDG